MSFAFDSGWNAAPVKKEWDWKDAFLDGVKDSLPVGFTPTQYHDQLAQDLKGKFRSAKKAETVRRWFHRFAEEIEMMSRHDPDIHDDLLLELVGRLDELN